jgi:hypothetical protein
MKDFNIAKYLKENHLGSHAILGAYVDLHGLKEEDETKLDTEIPYEGPEHKLDGFGDEFVQDKPVEELEKPEKIYSNDWMNDSVDGKRVGSWTCYYEDHLGVLYWIHDNIPSEDAVVYATPNWDGAKGIAVEVQSNYGEQIEDHQVVGDPSYPDFESYAQDMIPVLKKVEAEYKVGGSQQDTNESMYTDDSVDPFPSINKGSEYDDDDASDYDRFDDLGGNQIKSAIKSLMDDGFDSREIAQFVVDTIRGFKSFKEEVTVSSSGVQMEGDEFKWTARDQQGKLHGILFVKPMGDSLMITADDGMPGTKYTKADIADAIGRGEFIRFRGKDLALDTRMKDWANS